MEGKLKERARVLAAERRRLPVWEAREALLERMAAHDVVVVVGETGSGKTTQIPQFLVEAGRASSQRGERVAVTQPRRVAAMAVAQRVAEEVGCTVGGAVGYSVRFDEQAGPDTAIKYMTDGMLLREAMLDVLLREYGTVILDEAHERTLHTDILFGLVKRALARRNKEGSDPAERLKVVVMSATLDSRRFVDYFGPGTDVAWVQGRQFPVDVLFTAEPEEDYVDAALITTLQIHVDEPVGSGDILVFLTGQEEIEALERLLHEKAQCLPPRAGRLMVCPIYAALPAEQQMRVFERTPPGCRKVVLATNIAETSITISGVRFVVDTGVVKARTFNPRIGIEQLAVQRISKAQGRQRAGRAGREQAGKCFRLYPERVWASLADTTVPEIRRCNLASVVLQLKALGINNVARFDYMDAPPREALCRALETLFTLGALDRDGNITQPLGTRMAQLPIDPPYAKVLLTADTLHCTSEVLTIVAMLSAESVFVNLTGAAGAGGVGDDDGDSTKGSTKSDRANTRLAMAIEARNKFSSPDGDQMTMLAVFNEYIGLRRRGKVATVEGEAPHSKNSQDQQESVYVTHQDPVKRMWCQDHAVNYRAMMRVENVRVQLEQYLTRMGMTMTRCAKADADNIRKCFVAGFFMNVATLRADRTYRTMVSNRLVSVHPSSVLFSVKPQPPCLLYNELVQTTRTYIRDLMVIDHAWLLELAPHLFTIRANAAAAAAVSAAAAAASAPVPLPKKPRNLP